MTNKLVTLAGCLAVAGVIGTYYAKPLAAQVRAALVSDVDNPARNPVRLSTMVTGNDALECRTLSYTVPAGKRLMIDDVSANPDLPVGSLIPHSIQLLATPGDPSVVCSTKNPIAAVPFRSPVQEPGARYHASAHESMQVRVEAGESIGFEIRSVVAGAVTISYRYRVYVSGHLVSLP